MGLGSQKCCAWRPRVEDLAREPQLPLIRTVRNPGALLLPDKATGPHSPGAPQWANLQELKNRTPSIVITRNRAVDEWLSLFDNPFGGNSALDRLAHASYQIGIEGSI